MFSSTIHTQPLLLRFYPVPTPFPFHSTIPNLVSDLLVLPHLFPFLPMRAAPPFLIPIVGCTNLFYLYVSQPAREPGFFSPIWHCRTDWSTVRPIGSSHYNIQLLWRRESGKVCMCVCVAQEFAVFTGGKPWSIE